MSIMAHMKTLSTPKPKRHNDRTCDRNPEAGFTLVELLVVLGIIGLLVAIATPQVIKYLDRAKVSTARSQIEHLMTAADLFKLDVGRYPTTEEGIAALVVAPDGIEQWRGPYLKKGTNLKDPWGKPYQYKSPGQHADVDIYSSGPGSGDNQLITSW